MKHKDIKVIKKGQEDRYCDWLHTHQQELLLTQLEWFEEMVNRHDPMANKKSNPNYWGNTLRLELSDFKAHLTKDINSNKESV